MAILKANRALGPEYDEETAQQLLERLHSQPDPVAASHERGRGRHGHRPVIPFFALSIPVLAIAGGIAHGPGVLGVLLLDAVMLLGPWKR